MRAALLLDAGAGPVVTDVEALPPGPRDVVVAVECTSVCHTDLDVVAGRLHYGLPLVIGHEACGTVVATGTDVTLVSVGDRVVSSTAPSCGDCWSCRNGHPNVCVLAEHVRTTPRVRLADGRTAAALYGLGSFAEQMTVHEASVVAVDSGLPAAQLALLGCGVTTGAAAVLRRGHLRDGAAVAVLGAGAVGLAAVQAARIAGAATVIASEPLDERRRLAERLGATLAVDPAELVGAAVEATAGRGVDLTIDAVGTAASMHQAFEATRRAGRCVVVGLPRGVEQFPIAPWEWFLSEQRWSSALFGSAEIRRDLQHLADLAAAGSLDLHALAAATAHPLERVGTALDDLSRGRALRPLITPGS